MPDNDTTNFQPKRDKYSSARGGNSHFLNISCSGCKQYITTYQKDGHGGLLRLYLDRIFAPEILSRLQLVAKSKKDIPNLVCSKCSTLIGAPMIYEKEERFAFRLIHGSFTKNKRPNN